MLFVMVHIDVIALAFTKIGIPSHYVFTAFIASFMGSFINFPIKRIPRISMTEIPEFRSMTSCTINEILIATETQPLRPEGTPFNDMTVIDSDGILYEIGTARLWETARGQIMGLLSGLLKILFKLEEQRLLGVHIIVKGATELIHIGQATPVLEGILKYYLETIFNCPSLAEAYKVVALDACNRLNT